MNNFGSTTYDGDTYVLTGDADLTNRLLDGGYNDAIDGEDYVFEMAAPAVAPDGSPCRVSWVFSGVKGESDLDLECYDYSVADAVYFIGLGGEE